MAKKSAVTGRSMRRAAAIGAAAVRSVSDVSGKAARTTVQQGRRYRAARTGRFIGASTARRNPRTTTSVSGAWRAVGTSLRTAMAHEQRQEIEPSREHESTRA